MAEHTNATTCNFPVGWDAPVMACDEDWCRILSQSLVLLLWAGHSGSGSSCHPWLVSQGAERRGLVRVVLAELIDEGAGEDGAVAAVRAFNGAAFDVGLAAQDFRTTVLKEEIFSGNKTSSTASAS